MGRPPQPPESRVKWEAVASEIAIRISKNKFGGSGYLPPERTLAEDLGVSRPTLRKAIQSLTDTGVLRSVPGIGTKVNSEPPSRVVSAPPLKIIALALPDITNRFYVEVTEAIEYTLLQRGYQLLLGSYRHQPAVQDQQLRQFASHAVKGVILGHYSAWDLPDSLGQLAARSIPAVLLFSVPLASRHDVVVIDERAGVEQVMRYLFSLGHQRIAYCQPVRGTTPHVRELAFRDIMKQAGFAVPNEFVIPMDAVEDAGAAGLRRLIRGRHRPTAIFAGNDHVAVMTMKRLAEAGLRIPADVSVVGFDNLSYTEHLAVPLTTVDQPKDVLGRRAAELLLDRVELGGAAGPRREVYQPRLVIRHSCAVPPAL